MIPRGSLEIYFQKKWIFFIKQLWFVSKQIDLDTCCQRGVMFFPNIQEPKWSACPTGILSAMPVWWDVIKKRFYGGNSNLWRGGKVVKSILRSKNWFLRVFLQSKPYSQLFWRLPSLFGLSFHRSNSIPKTSIAQSGESSWTSTFSYRGEGYPKRNIWSLRALDQGSPRCPQLLGTCRRKNGEADPTNILLRRARKLCLESQELFVVSSMVLYSSYKKQNSVFHFSLT